MNISTKHSALILGSLLVAHTDAFVPFASKRGALVAKPQTTNALPKLSSLHAANAPPADTEEDVDRLRSMAAKLRAEAAALEAEQAQEIAEASERDFRRFDTNQDGEISLAELRAGLEKVYKKEIPEPRVERLLQNFDSSGDGALQVDEFATLDRLRNNLDSLAREERAATREQAKAARIEQEAVELRDAKMELINDKPPTTADKLLSVVPYLLPLMDSLVLARFLIEANPDSPLSTLALVLYGAYRSVPFGGLVGIAAMSFLSSKFSINRLIRFNMQQALSLDISLFYLSLLGAASNFLQLPASVTEIGSDAAFVGMVAAVGYACVSSLFGAEPDKIPFISGSVRDRTPTIDMFDNEGRFIGPQTGQEEMSDKED